MTKPKVLSVGLEPSLINFTDPAYAAFPGMTAEKVMAGLNRDVETLNGLGYSASLCLVDFGETAEAVLKANLSKAAYDCIVIGAGVRLIAQNTDLFEKLVNVIHKNAPDAKLCFNTRPDDTADAIQRWV